MKTNLVLKNIEVAGVKIGEVSVTQEYSASEAINLMMGGKDFIKSLIKDLPEMAMDLKEGYDTVEAINHEEVEETQCNDSIETSFKSMTNAITYEYCLKAIRNATCENEIDEVVDYARMRMSPADYVTIANTAIQRKQEIGVWHPFM